MASKDDGAVEVPSGKDPPKETKDKKPKKSPNPNIVIPPKKPKLTKAERRALQEKQRAAKAAAGAGGGGGGKKKGGGGGGGKNDKNDKNVKEDKKKKEASSDFKKVIGTKEGDGEDSKALDLFSHLPQFHDRKRHAHEFVGVTLGPTSNTLSSAHNKLHPAIIALGHSYSTHSIRGSNARARSMLRAFQTLLRSSVPFRPPPSSNQKFDIRHHITNSILKPAFEYWTTKCRPHSVTMGNAFSFLKLAVANLERDMNEDEMVEVLCERMDAYVRERIDFADRAISVFAREKIVEGDVVLVFGYSEVIELILRDAHGMTGPDGGGNEEEKKEGGAKKGKKKFRVIVADSRPLLEGRILLRKLVSHGIECSYVHLNAVSYVMTKEVTKVFLGAAALMSNGSVLSRVGTACITLMARSNNVPVLVCAETYKISNRVQLDSGARNEFGDPDDLATTSIMGAAGAGFFTKSSKKNQQPEGTLSNWRDQQNLKLLNLLYDLTPADFVSGIVTEMGILPPTSVAVLLREMSPQDDDMTF